MTCCLCCCWPGRPGLATGGAFWLRWCCWPAGLLAILGAAWAAQAFAPAIGDAFLSPFLTRQVTLALAEAGGDAAAALENFTFLPDSVRAALESVLSSFSDDAAAQTAEGLMAVLLPFVKAGIFLVACLVLRRYCAGAGFAAARDETRCRWSAG